MIEQIEYYRSVLNQIIEKLKSQDYKIKLEWVSGDGREFGYRIDSHNYTEKCKYKLLEARMQLGNTLKYISTRPEPYRQASLDRMSGKDDYIPDPVDTTKSEFNFPEFHSRVERIDYLRELLDEMRRHVYDIHTQLVDEPELHSDDAVNNLSLARNYLGKVLYCIKQVRENE